jgi:hypothetical protein
MVNVLTLPILSVLMRNAIAVVSSGASAMARKSYSPYSQRVSLGRLKSFKGLTSYEFICKR